MTNLTGKIIVSYQVGLNFLNSYLSNFNILFINKFHTQILYTDKLFYKLKKLFFILNLLKLILYNISK